MKVTIKPFKVSLIALVFLLYLCGSIYAQGQALFMKEDYPGACKSFILPAVGYNYNSILRHGITAGIKVVRPYKGSDCATDIGSLAAYIMGASYQLSGGYYPATNSGDVALSAGYRFLFLFPEASFGYSFSSQPEFPKQFFHAGPSLGVDLLVAQLNVGYSFRTKKIDNKSGAFTLSVVFSPFALNDKDNRQHPKTILNSSSKERKAARELLRKN